MLEQQETSDLINFDLQIEVRCEGVIMYVGLGWAGLYHGQ
jgi:hypothetical protein